MNSSSDVRQARFIVLDSAHLACIARLANGDREQRRQAETFIHTLLEQGWVLLLCWHHIEELLQHQNDEVVDGRLRFLWRLPYVAWIRSSAAGSGLGSIVDVMSVEAETAYRNPQASACQIRDLSRIDLISTGSPAEAIPDIFADWRLLRSTFAQHQEHARKVVAISRWRAADLDKSRIGDLLGLPMREPEIALRFLEQQRRRLAVEIATRGDKRIEDPERMATEFITEVARTVLAIEGKVDSPPVIRLLAAAGVEPDDIDPELTFAELMNKVTFQKKLRMVSDARKIPWRSLKTTVTQDRLPTSIITDAMRRCSQDQPERKGSELNDLYLLCLAPYADATFVDKRTMEGVRQGRRKIPVFDNLLNRVHKAGNHLDIARHLSL